MSDHSTTMKSVALESLKRHLSLYMWFAGILFISLIVLWPLFHPGFIITDDGNWMVIRLSAFYQTLREGQFPVRFLGRLNNSYGYPVANFLYPGYLYIGSVLHYFGLSFTFAIKCIFAGSVVTAGTVVFVWLKRHVSQASAFIGAVYFFFGAYLLFDIYKRGSVGEVLAIAFASITLYCIEARKYFFLGISFSLLLISHNSVALLFSLFFLIFLLLKRDKQGILSLFLGLGIASFFWFPALFEKGFVSFDKIFVSNPSEYFVTFQNILLIGIPSVMAVIWYFVAKPTKISKIYLVSYIVPVLLATPLSQIIWQIDSVAKIFQFPYRLLSCSLLFGTYLVAIMTDQLPSKIRNFFIGFVILLASWQMVMVFRSVSYSYVPEGYYTTNEATTTVADEYMPIWVKEITKERPTVRLGFQKGRGTIDLDTATTQRIDAHVITHEDSILQINSIYYPGWGVLVNDIPVVLDYDNPNGVIRFLVPKGQHHIVAEFRETIPRFLADVVSLLSLIAFVFYHMSRNIHKNFSLTSLKSLVAYNHMAAQLQIKRKSRKQ